jgi:trehalose 6-phosphate phosphatase
MPEDLPLPGTPEGRAGLDAIAADPAHALIASDFDGTLSPIVADPASARAYPGAADVLGRLASAVGTVAIITGRPAADAVRLGGLEDVPGLIVLGHYGAERWQDGTVTAAPVPPGIAVVRVELPRVLAGLRAGAGAPVGTRIEDKGTALAVHTRQTADPDGALRLLREPLAKLATKAGLGIEPGKAVLEIRPTGIDKGGALTALVAERGARSVLFCGDDLGDLAAFAAVRDLRADGVAGCCVASRSPESGKVAAAADLVVDGPAGIVQLMFAVSAAVAAETANRADGGYGRPGA